MLALLGIKKGLSWSSWGTRKEECRSSPATQATLPVDAAKEAEAFMLNGRSGPQKVRVYFFRSARMPDYRTTDDEFTPYVFHDRVLTATAWNVWDDLEEQEKRLLRLQNSPSG